MYSFYIFNIIVLLCVCVCVYMIVCRLNLLVVKLKSKKIFETKNIALFHYLQKNLCIFVCK